MTLVLESTTADMYIACQESVTDQYRNQSTLCVASKIRQTQLKCSPVNKYITDDEELNVYNSELIPLTEEYMNLLQQTHILHH